MLLTQHFPRLLGDIGGTHARLAWQAAPDAPLTHVSSIASAAFPSIAQAVEWWMAQGPRQAPVAACLGVATAVVGDLVAMTNHPWVFSIQALRQRLGLQQLLVINDFTALALALPSIPPHHLRQAGGGRGDAQAPLALIGPGTGLGVSGLLPSVEGPVPIAGEGGHVSLAAQTDTEWAVIQRLRARHAHVSAERVLSGPGLGELYLSLCQVRGVTPLAPPEAAEIARRALAGQDSLCQGALDLFFEWLGSVAGDLALTLGARGGVYIGGGIVPRLVDAFMASGFRRRFEDKGRFADYLRDVPVWVITAPDSPALWGAARALDRLSAPSAAPAGPARRTRRRPGR